MFSSNGSVPDTDERQVGRLAVAEKAIATGWHVFPCKPHTKVPATDHGFKDASADQAQIEAWFRSSIANIGVACGASGLVVLDFDIAKEDFAGDELLELLEEQHPTVEAYSPSRGIHLIYRQRPGMKLTNKIGNLPKGVDVRGDGGYILIAPSDVTYTGKDAADHGVPDGFNGQYRWRPGLGPDEVEVAVIPAFIIDMILGPKSKPIDSPTRSIPAGDSVIAEFNRTHGIVDILTKHGYTLVRSGHDYARLARPDRDVSSVVVFMNSKPERSYHHSTSDVLHTDDHARDAFDVWTLLVHGGDTRKAFETAKREQGKWEEKTMAPSNKREEKAAAAPVTAETAEVVADEEVDEPDAASPLLAADQHELELGWIDEYATLMTHLTGSPFEFNRLAGLVVAAAAIQRKAVLKMSFGDIYPNIYAAIVARSSVFHKSSAISKTRSLLRRAELERLILSELATSEGLLKQLSNHGNGLIVRDEIGTLFASHNTKYLATLKPDLTALYDCYPYSRRLSQEEVKVEEPYLNILGATTPARFYDGVSLTDWQDGFLARWLFVMPDGEPDFDAMTGLFTPQHDAKLGALSSTLTNIDRQQPTPFTLAGDAHKLWDTWQRKSAKEAYFHGDDVVAAIVTRYAAYALKFAMILAAVNGSWGVITPEIMQTAIDLADNYKHGIGQLLSERSNYGISGAKLQKAFAIIKKKDDGKGVSSKTIQQFAHLKTGDVTLCVEKLLEIGAICEKNDTSKGKRYMVMADDLPVKSWR